MKLVSYSIVSVFICTFLSLACVADRYYKIKNDRNVYAYGGIVRTDPEKRRISLVFTAADYADGTSSILSVLSRERITGTFFLGGRFFERFPEQVTAIRDSGHYIGPHGYDHLLYCAWENRDSTIVTREALVQDLRKNCAQLKHAGIGSTSPMLFMPPYEYYNREIVQWAAAIGLRLVNFTSGTWSNADYTTPDMKNYRSSKIIYDKILEIEEAEGLNGHIMLLHLGTHPNRIDKFYPEYLERMIRELKLRGYMFVPLWKAIR